jgi:uncharacterized membrane protein
VVGVLVALPGAFVVAELLAWLMGAPMLPHIERFTGPWCHYDPARTLRVSGTLLPVCARCTGLYAGLVLGPLLGLLLPRDGAVLLRVVGAALAPVGVGLGAALLEALGLVATGNVARLVLGLLLTTGPAALAMVGAGVLADALQTG